jgi:hypothetical protein
MALACLSTTGCTMCPDPFDYAGPVPNGSVAQNDFAARSQGILPVRATQLPWPPIVDATPAVPTPADDPHGSSEPEMLATMPRSPIEAGADNAAVLEVTLEEAVVDGYVPLEVFAGLPDGVADAADEPAVTGADRSSDRQWQSFLQRRKSGHPATVSDDSEAPPDGVILESRLPKDIPSVLLR